MTVRRLVRPGVVSCVVMLALGLTAGCAPAPAPSGVTPPPQTAPPPGTTTPREPVTPGLRLHGEPTVDVGLAVDIDSLLIASTRGPLSWRVAGGGENGKADRLLVRQGGAGLDVRVAAATGVWSTVLTLGAYDTLWIGEPHDGPGAAAPQLYWSNKTWRGQGKVFASPRGGVTFALRVPLETYLIGVVPGEIGALSDELIEAGRAQAIAARSYTLYYRGRRGGEGFDLYGTVDDQVYGPVESERPLATRCVETTRGRFGASGGQPIRANYCSTCGGITADVWEGFPATGFPYLKSHRDGVAGADYCARSPHYRWREEWSADAFVETVERNARPQGIPVPSGGLGNLVDVRVMSRSTSGRVWRMEIVGSRGTLVVPAYSLRWVLRRPSNPTSILRSTLIKIDVRRDRTTRRALAVIATGAGSGHGVGLCQTGALGMARGGKSGEAILEHYYPGASLVHAY